MAKDTKDAYYFRHDSNTRNDPKIIKLRRVLGREASDVFFDILSILREQSGYRLLVCSIPDIAYDLRYQEAKLVKIVNDFGLFVTEGEYFHSERLSRDMEEWDRQKQFYKERGKKAGRASADKRATIVQQQVENKLTESQPLNKVILSNNNKIEQIDTNVSKAPAPEVSDSRPEHAPTWQQVYEAFFQLGRPDDARTFFDHYEAIGWVMSNSKITNVKALANKWMANPISQANTAKAITGRKVIMEFNGGEVEWTEDKLEQYRKNPAASGYTFVRYE